MIFVFHCASSDCSLERPTGGRDAGDRQVPYRSDTKVLQVLQHCQQCYTMHFTCFDHHVLCIYGLYMQTETLFQYRSFLCNQWVTCRTIFFFFFFFTVWSPRTCFCCHTCRYPKSYSCKVLGHETFFINLLCGTKVQKLVFTKRSFLQSCSWGQQTDLRIVRIVVVTIGENGLYKRKKSCSLQYQSPCFFSAFFCICFCFRLTIIEEVKRRSNHYRSICAAILEL